MQEVPQIPSETQSSSSNFRYAALLALILLASRVPLLSHPTPVHPDEIAFQAALGFPADYPVHAPGYPLWIGIGTVVKTLGAGNYFALAVWSLIASILGPLILYRLLSRRFDVSLAWWTALCFGVCPLAWFHSVSAMTYWPATIVGLIVVANCARALESERRAPLLAAASALAVGVFLRTDCLIYFGPMFAFVLWRRRSISAGTVALIPLFATIGFYALAVYLYGRGEAPLFAERFGHSRDVLLGTSVFKLGLTNGLVRNILKIGVNLGWNLTPLGVGLISLLAIKQSRREKTSSKRDVTHLLMLWLVPGLVFLALFHVVEGYFMWLLPGFFVAAAAFLNRRYVPKVATRTMAVVALISMAQFVAYPWSTTSHGLKRTIDAKIGYLSATGLLHIDERETIHKDGDFWHTDAHE